MGFKTFLESKKLDLDTVIDGIKKDCKPFLKSKATLYRGMHPDDKHGVKKVRKNRKPLDSEPLLQLFLDKFSEMKNLPKRSASLFTTRDAGQAGHYGYAYYVFPKGKYRVLQYPKIRDMYFFNLPFQAISDVVKKKDLKNLEFDEAVKYVEGILDKKDLLYDVQGTLFDRLMQHLKKYKLTQSGKPVPDNKVELIVECDDYYYVISDEVTIKRLEQEGLINQ